jgi:DsbC/DsbD-like thiol-disulfide interchange protein
MTPMTMFRSFAAFGGLLLLGSGAVGGATSPWIRNPQSAVRLVTPYTAAPRTGDVRLGVEFNLPPGWHAYWRNPGSAGFPPGFASQSPELRIVETRWPAPSRFDLPGDLVAFGYAGEVLYPLRGRLESAADSVRLVVNADYLVCEVDCVPYRYDLTLDQPLADIPTSDPEGEAALAAWEARVPAPITAVPGFLVEGAISWEDDDHGVMRLEFPSAQGEPALFLESHDLLELGLPERDSRSAVAFAVPVTRKDVRRALPLASDFGWTLVGLQGGTPPNVEGRTSVSVREHSAVDWRWLAAAAALIVLCLVWFLRRRPAAADNL